MKVKLGDYRVQYNPIKHVLEKENPKDINKFITTFAACYHVPIIVVAHYVSEMIGMKPEIQELIDRITKFYGYTEVTE
jgi:hypothetical protein